MTAQTKTRVQQQRDELVNKVENEVDRKVNLGNAILQHHRVILQDLPFDGQPGLLNDEHREAIERLVEKNLRYQITIKRIIGYASKTGDELDNEILSQRRADEVHNHLLTAIGLYGFIEQDILSPTFSVLAKGESDLPHPTNAEFDNPLNRRVEIVFILKYVFPVPTGGEPQTSTMWKIDFGPAASGNLLQAGLGTLTMLPDGENGLNNPVTKSLKFEQLGVSMGLFSKLKNLKFIKKFPMVRRMLHDLDPERAGNYVRTRNLLQNIGVSMDFVSEGGEFETPIAVSFEQMQNFNYATISAGLSILGKAEGAMLILNSENFYAFTLIFGVGQNIAVPDFEVQFIPAGFVQVTLN